MYHETILLGVLVSLIYTEFTGLSAGLIVPGYLVLSLHSPSRVLWTLLVAGAAVLLCRLLSRWLILYGRRRFALLLLLTYLLSGGLGLLFPAPSSASVIGMLIPGLVARELDRQGPVPAILSIAITTSLLSLLMLAQGYPVFGH